jgi:hypothetical protein
MNDEENVVKVNFTDKRPRPGAKPKANLAQSKTAGIIVVVIIVAFIFLTHFVLPNPPANIAITRGVIALR